MGFFLLTIVCTAGLIESERRADQRGVMVFKPLAALGFVGAALSMGALDSSYGVAVLAALCLSLLGDLMLIPKGNGKMFLGGLGAFLMGHLGFAVAFVVRGVDPVWSAGAAVVFVAVAIVVGRWLLPNIKKERMKRPVVAYIVVITAMAALSVGTWPVATDWRIPAAALMFFTSDLAVARHRFIQPAFSNKVWGLPLYFGAQLLFAWTVT